MKSKYLKAFVIPAGAQKIAGEDGWEFVSSEHLSLKNICRLVELLGLKFTESFLGIDTYANHDTEMAMVCDDGDAVEFLDIRLPDISMEQLRAAFNSVADVLGAELFIPAEVQPAS